MSLDSEDSPIVKMDAAQPRPGVARALLLRLIELWLAAVLVAFFLIRVLGSHTAQRLLGGIRRSHMP